MGRTAKAKLYSKEIEEQDANMGAPILRSGSGGICGKEEQKRQPKLNQERLCHKS